MIRQPHDEGHQTDRFPVSVVRRHIRGRPASRRQLLDDPAEAVVEFLIEFRGQAAAPRPAEQIQTKVKLIGIFGIVAVETEQRRSGSLRTGRLDRPRPDGQATPAQGPRKSPPCC